MLPGGGAAWPGSCLEGDGYVEGNYYGCHGPGVVRGPGGASGDSVTQLYDRRRTPGAGQNRTRATLPLLLLIVMDTVSRSHRNWLESMNAGKEATRGWNGERLELCFKLAYEPERVRETTRFCGARASFRILCAHLASTSWLTSSSAPHGLTSHYLTCCGCSPGSSNRIRHILMSQKKNGKGKAISSFIIQYHKRSAWTSIIILHV